VGRAAARVNGRAGRRKARGRKSLLFLKKRILRSPENPKKTSGRKNLLFVNKKKQKNFIRWQPALSPTGVRMKKVFLLLFFQKKKTLPACHLPGFFRVFR
jgi:hypothetical protein